MNTTTKAHFAKLCGISKAAVSKASQNGLLGLYGEGRKQVINLDSKKTKDYMSEKATGVKAKRGKPGPKSEADKLVDQLKITAKESSAVGIPMVRSLDDVTGANIALLDKRDLDKLHVWEKAKETQLKREERRGLLIPRNMVRQIFSKLYSIYVNQFKTMEDRLTPDICGIFGLPDNSPEAVQLRKLLNDDTAKTLKHIKRLFDDFLVKVDADKL